MERDFEFYWQCECIINMTLKTAYEVQLEFDLQRSSSRRSESITTLLHSRAKHKIAIRAFWSFWTFFDSNHIRILTSNMTPAPKSTERPSKKAKIDPPQKLSAKRIKGSPRPQAKKSATTPSVSVKGKEKAATKPKPASKKRPTEDEDDAPEVSLPSTFKIIAGSYEKLLYGLEGSVTADGQDGGFNFHIKPMFIFPAHVSCIKAVSASPHGGKWLATGSADEIVKVWDLRRRKEIGGLMHHEGLFASLYLTL